MFRELISSSEFPELPSNVSPGTGLPLLWYGAEQRNSGGYIHNNDEVGDWVFVQATSPLAAIGWLESITATSDADSCYCCCSRWNVEADVMLFGGHPEPLIN